MTLPIRRAPPLFALLAVLASSRAHAQQGSRSDGFVDFRYASRSSLALFGGYQSGSTLLIVGMVQNPRTEYREIVAGAARTLGGGPASVTVALAGADASDGVYGQLYLLPSVAAGPVVVSGLVQVYTPLDSDGAAQFYINPVRALVPVGGRVSIGPSYALATQTGTDPRHSAGPAIQLNMPNWSATLTAFAGLGRDPGEVWMSIHAGL